MFRRADWMNGLEGWRRLVRRIDHSQAIHLETLRRQVQDLHTKPIRSLEDIEEGVASFENIMAEYVKAGGPQAPDGQMKADLLRVLPKEISELLLWHSTDTGVSFARFRDTVVNQTAQVLMNRGGPRSVNAVDAADASGEYEKILKKLGEGICDMEKLLDDLYAAIVARRGRGAQPGGRQPQRAKSETRGSDAARPLRRWPNC